MILFRNKSTDSIFKLYAYSYLNAGISILLIIFGIPFVDNNLFRLPFLLMILDLGVRFFGFYLLLCWWFQLPVGYKSNTEMHTVNIQFIHPTGELLYQTKYCGSLEFFQEFFTKSHPYCFIDNDSICLKTYKMDLFFRDNLDAFEDNPKIYTPFSLLVQAPDEGLPTELIYQRVL